MQARVVLSDRRQGVDVMTDPGPDGSGVGAEGRVGDPKMPPAKERAEDRDAKGLQDHGDSGADETSPAWEAERVAQQPDCWASAGNQEPTEPALGRRILDCRHLRGMVPMVWNGRRYRCSVVRSPRWGRSTRLTRKRLNRCTWVGDVSRMVGGPCRRPSCSS